MLILRLLDDKLLCRVGRFEGDAADFVSVAHASSLFLVQNCVGRRHGLQLWAPAPLKEFDP